MSKRVKGEYDPVSPGLHVGPGGFLSPGSPFMQSRNGPGQQIWWPAVAFSLSQVSPGKLFHQKPRSISCNFTVPASIKAVSTETQLIISLSGYQNHCHHICEAAGVQKSLHIQLNPFPWAKTLIICCPSDSLSWMEISLSSYCLCCYKKPECSDYVFKIYVSIHVSMR